MKVGDLVKISRNDSYWWGGQIGIVDLIEDFQYRVWIADKGHTTFTDHGFVKVINESR